MQYYWYEKQALYVVNQNPLLSCIFVHLRRPKLQDGSELLAALSLCRLPYLITVLPCLVPYHKFVRFHTIRLYTWCWLHNEIVKVSRQLPRIPYWVILLTTKLHWPPVFLGFALLLAYGWLNSAIFFPVHLFRTTSLCKDCHLGFVSWLFIYCWSDDSKNHIHAVRCNNPWDLTL